LPTPKRVPNRSQVQPNSGPKKAFGDVLREFRQAKGLSQEQLAEIAGLDRSFVSLVERGIQSPNILILLKLAEVLGVRASMLIERTEEVLGLAVRNT
jgi:transcriptional regulator with XRE-family HTH domain